MYHPRARAFVRAIIARAAAATENTGFAADEQEAARLASDRWGRGCDAALVLRGMSALRTKAGVAGGGTDSGEWGAELADLRTAATEFLELVDRISAYGRLPGKRRVPPLTPLIAIAGGATAHWVGQSKAIPVSAMDLIRTSLGALKPSALIVRSRELFLDASPEAEALLEGDLVRAVARLVDETAFGGAAGTPRLIPDALNYGSPTLASVGSLADDIESMVQMFSGQLSTAAFVMHPRTAMAFGLRAGGRGVAADLGALGGSLAGLPALTSEGISIDSDGAGQIILVDGNAVVEVDEGIDITTTTEGAIELDDAPQGAGDTPTAASATLISLWQSDLIALKAVRRLNFVLGRAQACVTLTGVTPQTAS